MTTEYKCKNPHAVYPKDNYLICYEDSTNPDIIWILESHSTRSKADDAKKSLNLHEINNSKSVNSKLGKYFVGNYRIKQGLHIQYIEE